MTLSTKQMVMSLNLNLNWLLKTIWTTILRDFLQSRQRYPDMDKKYCSHCRCSIRKQGCTHGLLLKHLFESAQSYLATLENRCTASLNRLSTGFWFFTFSDHHMDQLSMQSFSAEPYLLYLRDGYWLNVIALQVGDSARFGGENFLQMKEKYSNLFCTNPHKITIVGTSDRFNGTDFMLEDNSVVLHQGPKFADLQYPENDSASDSICAKIQYVAFLA